MKPANQLKHLNDLLQKAQKQAKRAGSLVLPAIVTIGVVAALFYLILSTVNQQAQLGAFDRKVQQVPDVEKRLTLEKDRLTLENAVNATRAQVIGGVLVFFTAFTAWRNLKVAEEKQVTERFSKAVEQLGHEKDDVRLGAIYSLERIANDSDKDYWQVIEILTAYVRGRSLWTPDKERQNLAEVPPLPIHIQAALTVLGRRKHTWENGEKHPLDLCKTDLRKADLRGAKMQGVLLSETHLEGAKLYKTHLEGADLFQAHLEGADLYLAHLEGAKLSRAHLERADLPEAHLEEADLTYSYLEGADMSGTHLEGANLSHAHLEGTKLYLAHLEGANLSHAHLEGTRLHLARLKGAKNLTPEQLSNAITAENTNPPDEPRLPNP